MRRFGSACCGAIFAAMFLAGAMPRAAAADATPANDHHLAIGVVRTTQILRAMHEAASLEGQFRTQQADLQGKQQQLEQEIVDMVHHRDQNKPGSQQWLAENDDIDKKRIDLEAWKSMANLKLERWYKQSLKGMYDHIADATAQIAEQEHLDLVIADQSPDIGPDLDKANAGQLEAALASRAVLFANKKADITQEVLTVVEANFAKQNPTSGPPPLPASGPIGGTGPIGGK